MGILEKSVIDLANALDNLESKLEHSLDDRSASGDRIAAARRQARAARENAAKAARGLSDAIDDLRGLIADSSVREKG
jgi:cell division septum initiation protein DivIVA